MDAKKKEQPELSFPKKASLYLLAAFGPHAIALVVILINWFFSSHELPCLGEFASSRKIVYVLDFFCAEMRSAFAVVSLLMFISAPIVYYAGRSKTKIAKDVAVALVVGALLGLIIVASMQLFLDTFRVFSFFCPLCTSEICCECWNPTC